MKRRGGKKVPGNPDEHFARLNRLLMSTPAWRALSSSAQAAYPWFLLEYKGARYNNNGKIRLSVRQLAARMGVVADTAARATLDLQCKGFIVQTEHARLGVAGEAKAPAYELTDLAMPETKPPTPRKLYKTWSAGHDFPVQRTQANNPQGRNGKTKPCPRNHDDPVLETMTKMKRLS